MTASPSKNTDGKKKEPERHRNTRMRQRPRENNSGAGGLSKLRNSDKPSAGATSSPQPSSKKMTQEKEQRRANSMNVWIESSDPSYRSPVNSDDEVGGKEQCNRVNSQLELTFAEALCRERGLLIKKMSGDGNCLFRAVAFHVYADEEMHAEVRGLCFDYMENNRDHFSQFVTEDFEEYVARKRKINTHGNHLEIQAISEMYARPVEIYEYAIQPFNVVYPVIGSPPSRLQAPIRLSYHDGCHYNAVYDPDCSTFGVGLGMPGPDPGQADEQLIQEALKRSEMDELERMMFEDKVRSTDWQLTESELTREAVCSSLIDHFKPRRAGSQATQKKTPLASPDRLGRPNESKLDQKSSASSPTHHKKDDAQPESNKQNIREAGLYEELLALEASAGFGSVEEDDDLLTQALLLSQAEYLEEHSQDSKR